MPSHDIVAIGASAGGVELLLELVPRLPAEFPAAILVVLHTPPEPSSMLPELLTARGSLPAVHPVHGDRILPGRIYVAPPDSQMIVRRGHVDVVRGPKENGHRPAVDPTFRSAARAYGPRVIGVVLSGFLDCGTAGMLSIKARGGVTAVQAPETAVAPDMPRSVLRRVRVDHVFQPSELAGLLSRLVREPAGGEERPAAAIEVLEGDRPGAPVAEVVCPLCQGVLTETETGGFAHFRCHEGHAFSLESLAREQSEEMERALWAAARALEEGAAVSARLANGAAGVELRRRFAENEAVQRRQAELIRALLLDHGGLVRPVDALGEQSGR